MEYSREEFLENHGFSESDVKVDGNGGEYILIGEHVQIYLSEEEPEEEYDNESELE